MRSGIERGLATASGTSGDRGAVAEASSSKCGSRRGSKWGSVWAVPDLFASALTIAVGAESRTGASRRPDDSTSVCRVERR